MRILILILFIFNFYINCFIFSDKKNSLYSKGMYNYIQGNYNTALSLFLDSFKENNNIPSIYYYIANIYSIKSEYNKAISYYEWGLEFQDNKSNINYIMNMAKSYKLKKDYRKALFWYKKIAYYSDLYPGIYLDIGWVYFKLRNKPGVIRNWSMYLAKNPNSSQFNSILDLLNNMASNKFSFNISYNKSLNNSYTLGLKNISKNSSKTIQITKSFREETDIDIQPSEETKKYKRHDKDISEDEMKRAENELYKLLEVQESELLTIERKERALLHSQYIKLRRINKVNSKPLNSLSLSKLDKSFLSKLISTVPIKNTIKFDSFRD